MSGHVVYRPEPDHECKPRLIDGIATDYPKGTVYECDCGTTWVCQGMVKPHLPTGHTSASLEWKRESRRARRKRERQDATPEQVFEGQWRLFERDQRLDAERQRAQAAYAHQQLGGHASGKPHGPLPVVSDRSAVGAKVDHDCDPASQPHPDDPAVTTTWRCECGETWGLGVVAEPKRLPSAVTLAHNATDEPEPVYPAQATGES